MPNKRHKSRRTGSVAVAVSASTERNPNARHQRGKRK